MADVTFRIQGKPEKMGSFNMTRDWFYKPLGESIAEDINSSFSSIIFFAILSPHIYYMN